MVLLSLAYHSLKNRKLTTTLTVFSIALSIALLIGVENVRVGARQSFEGTISQTDLIVGARGGSLQLLLYSVFRIGQATNNITYESYLKFKNHPAVEWTIPYSLGDSHRGFRVVGTDENFYKHLRYRRDRSLSFASGHEPRGVFDVALGADVARALNYKTGDKVVITHGVASAAGRGIQDHNDKPFTVCGVLNKTSTPVDRSLYIQLEGISAVHIDWADGAPPMPGEEVPAEKITKDTVKIDQITSFLLRNKRRIDTLRVQREINTFSEEPLQAILPGVTLQELWRTIGYAEDALTVVTFFVIVVGLLGMLVSLYTSLNERRREMAILRAIGAGPGKIISLLVFESFLLTVAGCVLGVGLIYGASFLFQPVVEEHFGLYIPVQAPTPTGLIYLGAVLAASLLIGFIPAWKAYRNTLSDGLTPKL
ncbi:MAG: FtsX-like permease family protein [Acidobacteria bacterium]|nr:FtsX-like permease family protein [Acidobacteriota bacterium]